MKNLIILFFLSVFLFFQSNIRAQNKLDLYFIEDVDVPAQRTFISNNGLTTYQVFYDQFFTTNESFDEKKFDKLLYEKFPDHNSSGFGVIDWEGEGIKHFRDQSNRKMFNHYKGEYIKAILYAKKKRPNIKWGFYHIMYLTYSASIEKFRTQNANLEELIRLQDFVAPSLYVYNPEEKYQRGNNNYMKNKLIQALEIGYKYSIPVYPFIWHRTTTNKIKGAGNSLIPIGYFKNVLDLITTTEYNGVRAKGVFWWHSESYSYRNRAKFLVAKREYSRVKDINQYQLDLFQKYYNSIKKYIN